MLDTPSLAAAQAALKSFCAGTPQTPASNVVSFAAAKAARVPQGERARAYRVRPAIGNDKGVIGQCGWYSIGMEELFLEITRLDDGKRAYCCKVDGWSNTDAFAHAAFMRWTNDCNFWRRLRTTRGELSYDEIREAWDIIVSPDCREVLGLGIREIIEKAPQVCADGEDFNAVSANPR
ncbi:MAG: hypothetical protein ACR652_01280 [Methylocystis sp.]|uniref:hypothetical protein n=1 Tax=Methylocystis sp. TaxID=1911079 RepID=UPI003DA641B5